ncbi:unnamed protein product [Paramecium sonneborni]|uniref:Transmembrane protein n=1 Tax=Paramecium sonneborni TaxID=65129 RepID=A0A8S1LK29_9CILI|nr:unnamed protein product [Paramecium sonneborni]
MDDMQQFQQPIYHIYLRMQKININFRIRISLNLFLISCISCFTSIINGLKEFIHF